MGLVDGNMSASKANFPSINPFLCLLVRVVVTKGEEEQPNVLSDILLQFLLEDAQRSAGDTKPPRFSSWWLRNNRCVNRVHCSINIGGADAGALIANAN